MNRFRWPGWWRLAQHFDMTKSGTLAAFVLAGYLAYAGVASAAPVMFTGEFA